MEGLDNFAFWIQWIVVICAAIYWYLNSQSNYWKDRGVRSMKSYPIFGSSLNLLLQPWHEAQLKGYQKYGRLYGAYENTRPVLIVAEPELIKDIFIKDFPSFPSRRFVRFGDKIIDNMVSTLPGEHWKRIRTLITPAFTSGKMRKMANIMNSSSETLLQNLLQTAKQGSYIDAKRLFGTFSMDVIVSSAFGAKLDSLNDPNNAYVVHARQFFTKDTTWRVVLLMLAPFLMKMFKVSTFSTKATYFFREATLEIVKYRRERGEVRNDFLQLLMDAANEEEIEANPKEDPKLKNDYGHEEGNEKIFSQKYRSKALTNDELVAQCVLFFIAGYDTTASTLSFIAYNLALNPECQERLIREIDEATKDKKQLDFDLVSEMKYLDQVISETLRLYPPAHRIERVAEEDYKLGDTGITVPKGMLLSFPVYAIHRDPEHFPNPEIFDPDRFSPENKAERHPFTFLPFGAGPRNCIGMRFALMEMKICLVYLLQNIRFKRCPETKVPLEFGKLQILMQPKSLLLTIEPRKDVPKK